MQLEPRSVKKAISYQFETALRKNSRRQLSRDREGAIGAEWPVNATLNMPSHAS